MFIPAPVNIPWNSEHKPRGLYFSKAIFERLIFGWAYIRRGLSSEGNLRFKIDWASLIVGSKFTVFALFYFVFEGNFPSTSPRGAYIWRGDFTEGFLRYQFGGLIFGGAYTRRGLFSEFYGTWLGEDFSHAEWLLAYPNYLIGRANLSCITLQNVTNVYMRNKKLARLSLSLLHD